MHTISGGGRFKVERAKGLKQETRIRDLNCWWEMVRYGMATISQGGFSPSRLGRFFRCEEVSHELGWMGKDLGGCKAESGE